MVATSIGPCARCEDPGSSGLYRSRTIEGKVCWKCLRRELGDTNGTVEEPRLVDELSFGLNGTTPDATSSLISFDQIVAVPVKWLWQDRVALSKITGLAGRPKIGKGLIYSRLIADVTHGTLAGDVREPRDAIILTTEDDPGDTLKPRLMAAAADLRRVHFFQMGSPLRARPVPDPARRRGTSATDPPDQRRAHRRRSTDRVHRRQNRRAQIPARTTSTRRPQRPRPREHRGDRGDHPPQQGRVDRPADPPRRQRSLHPSSTRGDAPRPRPQRPRRRTRIATSPRRQQQQPRTARPIAALRDPHRNRQGRHRRGNRHRRDHLRRRIRRDRQRPSRSWRRTTTSELSALDEAVEFLVAELADGPQPANEMKKRCGEARDLRRRRSGGRRTSSRSGAQRPAIRAPGSGR